MLTLKGPMDSRFRGNEGLALGHTSVFLGLRLGSLMITGSQSMPRYEPNRARLLAIPPIGIAPVTERNRAPSEPPDGK